MLCNGNSSTIPRPRHAVILYASQFFTLQLKKAKSLTVRQCPNRHPTAPSTTPSRRARSLRSPTVLFEKRTKNRSCEPCSQSWRSLVVLLAGGGPSSPGPLLSCLARRKKKEKEKRRDFPVPALARPKPRRLHGASSPATGGSEALRPGRQGAWFPPQYIGHLAISLFYQTLSSVWCSGSFCCSRKRPCLEFDTAGPFFASPLLSSF